MYGNTFVCLIIEWCPQRFFHLTCTVFSSQKLHIYWWCNKLLPSLKTVGCSVEEKSLYKVSEARLKSLYVGWI